MTHAAALNIVLFVSLLTGALMVLTSWAYMNHHGIPRRPDRRYDVLIRLALVLTAFVSISTFSVVLTDPEREVLRVVLLVIRGVALAVVFTVVIDDARYLKRLRA